VPVTGPNDRDDLIAALPSDGSAVGNTALIRQLGWKQRRYWTVRDLLIDEGRIAPGRGRGGSVRRIVSGHSPQASPIELEEEAVRATRREVDLYEPIQRVMAKEWCEEFLSEPLGVEIVAQQGGRITGGRWSRPDLVAVAVKTFQFLPGKYLEVHTFEVKPSTYADVSAVYEALAHRRSATHSWVFVQASLEEQEDLEGRFSDMTDVASEHDIGLIVAADPRDYDSWEHHALAVRHEADPELLNGFVETQLSAQLRDKVRTSVR
jgi:hypothetical protein